MNPLAWGQVQRSNRLCRDGIFKLRSKGRACAVSVRVGQPTVTASQVAKERAPTNRW